MRTLVISDIHGCYDEFMELLNLVKYRPGEDQLILLGDYVDRGPKSKEVVHEIIQLAKYEHVVVLRGNHDHRFLTLAKSMDDSLLEIFLKYGGHATLESYCKDENLTHYEKFNNINENYKEHIDILEKTKLYYEDEHYIYVHAGLNPDFSNWKDQPEKDFFTIREKFYKNPTKASKPVIFGHTITKKLHSSANIWFANDKIGIDGGCAYGDQLNCLEINANNELKEYHVKANN